MRCLGTLEFLCDFYELCHLTQNKLLEAQTNQKTTTKVNFRLEADGESDKENVVPPKKNHQSPKRKVKTLSARRPSYCQKNRKEPLMDSSLRENKLETENIVGSLNSGTVEEEAGGKKIPTEGTETSNWISSSWQTTRSESLLKDDKHMKYQFPLRNAKRVRKTKTKQLTLSGNCIVAKKDRDENDENRPKRRCLQIICPNGSETRIATENPNQEEKEEEETDNCIIKQEIEDTDSEKSREHVPNRNETRRNSEEPKKENETDTSSPTRADETETVRSSLEASEKIGLSFVEGSESESCPVDEREESFSQSSNSLRISGTFGKIGQLITDEQKETIEKYYKVDMSIVDSAQVERNITILDKKSIKCNICATTYPRMDKCQVHVWGHLKMKPYQCKACDFATVTVSNIRCHIRKSHLKIKPFSCQLCEKRYVTAVLLAEHLNTHTGARPFKCKLCDFASTSRQMLSYHSTTHKLVKDISCKVCGKEFYSRGRLRAHMFTHNKDKVFMCKLCSAYLSNAEALETHQKNLHMHDYECNVCGKRFKSKKALHNHQNVHAAAKYKCSMCPNVYKSSQILKEHLLKHEGIRKYSCNVCQKTFAQKSHVAAHMAVHSEIRFHCPGCGKPFNRHDNMKIHTRRCKLFTANPDFQDLLIKKELTKSVNFTRELTVSSKTDIDSVESQTDATKNASDTNFCKLGLNISGIDPTGTDARDRDPMEQRVGELTSSGEIDVFRIEKTNDKPFSENDETGQAPVIENMLEPEAY